jgi:hypothetical protein
MARLFEPLLIGSTAALYVSSGNTPPDQRRREVISHGLLFCQIYRTLARHNGRELFVG